MEYRVLKEYENELIDCLEDVNLVFLARYAAECGLVPRETKDNIESLHPDVPHPLICRYLLYYVYCSVKSDLTMFNIWLKLLSSNVRGIAKILSQVKECCDGLNTQKKQFILSKRHVSDITKILADCSSFWQKIAIALGLSHNEIRNITMENNNAPMLCLQDLLSGWVASKFSNTKSPTLENLVKALQSKLVGLGREASFLKERLDCLLFEILYEHDLASMRYDFKIIRQTQSEAVPEGSSILLEVQARTPLNHAVCVKWFKDKHQLQKPAIVQDSYKGCHVSILCIKAIDLLAEGIYSCHISDGNDSIASGPIFLTVTTSIDEYQRNLVSFYTEQPEVPEDTWPPEGCKAYISLALIKQNSIHHAGKFGRVTIHGDADDIYNDKEHLEYESAFNNLSSGTRLLVEGRPGSGKTTLVHKVSQDWAIKTLAFKATRLLFLVHLRAFSSDPNVGLNDVLDCYYQDSSINEKVIKYAQKHSGLGLIFILDGMDEYSPKNIGNCFISKLIKKLVLPKAIVIVASRPAAAADFRYVASRRVEVLGFLKKQIAEYVDSYPFSESPYEKNEKLKQYLGEHRNVHRMCYLPIHAAMVCYLFDFLETGLPQTETMIYQEFTKFSILRILYRTKNRSEFYLKSINDLAGPQREVFCRICSLAFEMCKSSKQVMTHDEAQPFLDIVQEDSISQSLITVDRMAMRCGFQKTYTFLHLTFQEFLGAYHIASLSEEEQCAMIVKFGKLKELKQVWKFYCGLTKFAAGCKFEALIDNSSHGDIFKVQCAFESQQPHTCDMVLKNNVLTMNPDTFLTLSNFEEIAYILSCMSSVPVMSINDCIIGEESAQAFVDKVGDVLQGLSVHNCNFTKVNYFLRTLPSLQMLDISDLEIKRSKDIDTLTCSLNQCNLRVLKVRWRESIELSFRIPKLLFDAFASQCSGSFHMYCTEVESDHNISVLPSHYHTACPYVNLSTITLGLAGMVALSMDLVKTPFFNRLTLISCKLDEDAASYLARGLKHCRDLEVLELGFNNIGHDGAVNIAVSLVQNCSKLQLLDFVHNNLCDASALAITNVLKGCHLKLLLGFNNITQHNSIYRIYRNVEFYTLNFSNNNLGREGCEKMASLATTCNWKDVLKLNLSNNNLVIEPFCSVLAQCSNLLVLDLSYNSLGMEGGRILSGVLKHCVKLHVLDISCNSLTSNDLIFIAEGIKYCCNLLQLKVGRNMIEEEGVFALVEGLKSCLVLKELIICSNDLQNGGARVLGFSFSHRTLLQWSCFCVLNVSSNDIGSYGIRALALGLTHCTTLEELYISHNKMQGDDAQRLALALKVFTNFQVLDVSSNNLRSSGATTIATALGHCSSLRKLDISDNRIRDEDVQHLASMFAGLGNNIIL